MAIQIELRFRAAVQDRFYCFVEERTDRDGLIVKSDKEI